MDISAVAISAYVLIVLLITITTSTFFIVNPLRKFDNKRPILNYVGGFFVVTAFAFLSFALIQDNPNPASHWGFSALLVIAFSCLRQAFIIRQLGRMRHLSKNPAAIIVIVSVPIVIVVLDKMGLKEPITTSLLLSVLVVLLLSSIQHVPLERGRFGYGERIMVVGLLISAMMLTALMAINLIIADAFIQLSAWAITFSVIIATMMGSIQTMLLSQLTDMYKQESTVDYLTQLYNRRFFFTRAHELVNWARRKLQTTCVVMLDIDNFKLVNDQFGHDIGDDVLKMVGKCVKQSIRDFDLAARYGGEEFCLLLTDTQIDDAWQVADRLRMLIANTVLTSNNNNVTVTASFGVAEVSATEDVTMALKQADKALYHAKQAGKNCVHRYQEHLDYQ